MAPPDMGFPSREEREELPDSFPVFPLAGALLLPHGRLPLNIFEPRYLAMTDAALGAGRLFGMMQPTGAPRGDPASIQPALHKVGCLGRIVSFAETPDGRYLVTLGGVSRFRLVEELSMARGYRRIRADFTPYKADLDESAAPLPDRAAILLALRPYFAQRDIDANWKALEGMEDADLLITLSMACPFEPLEKQALLEAPTPADRAQALLALLSMDAHSGPEPSTRPS